MKPFQVNLIKNPEISVKFVRDFKKLSDIEIQAWSISVLLTSAVCSNAVRLFLARIFSLMGTPTNLYDISVDRAFDAIEKMSREVPAK